MTPEAANAAAEALLVSLKRTIADLRSPDELAAAEAALVKARDRRGWLWERYRVVIHEAQEQQYSLGANGINRMIAEAQAPVAEADAEIKRLQAEVDRLWEHENPSRKPTLRRARARSHRPGYAVSVAAEVDAAVPGHRRGVDQRRLRDRQRHPRRRRPRAPDARAAAVYRAQVTRLEQMDSRSRGAPDMRDRDGIRRKVAGYNPVGARVLFRTGPRRASFSERKPILPSDAGQPCYPGAIPPCPRAAGRFQASASAFPFNPRPGLRA